MVKRITIILIVFIQSQCFTSMAQYTSPGQSKSWTLDSLVANSAGVVTYSEGAYIISNDVVLSESDTLKILNAAVIKTAAGKKITINGVIVSNPSEGRVIFSAIDSTNTANYFNGFRVENSDESLFRNTTIMHGGGIQLIDSDVLFEYCTIRNNNHSLTSGAINYSSASPIIRYCEFRENSRAAIASGANVFGSPQIFFNVFKHNVTDNSNRPQINLGPGAEDTIRIVGNYIEGLYPVSGGVGISNLMGSGSAKVLLKGNEIRNNRYGYTQIGGDISSVIKGNKVIDNNLETNPMNGGSGLNFLSTSAEGNISVIRENIITGNLWGITIQGIANPNLGTVDDHGMNIIFDNGNNGTPYDLYNNTALPVSAQYNYWGTNDEDEIEDLIFHQFDNPSLGLVTFLPNMMLYPVINSFNFLAANNQGLENDIIGNIDLEDKTILLNIPFGIDITSLVPDITVPYGVSVSPLSGVAQDFSQVVEYTVTVPHEQQVWNVIVEQDVLFSISFIVNDQNGNPIEDAIITFDGNTYEEGIYFFENLNPGEYPYSVSKDGYETVEGSAIIIDEDIIEIVVLLTTGMEEMIFHDFRVYPNPFTDQVLLSNPNIIKRVTIISANGQVIKSYEVNGQPEIPTKSIAPGFYMMCFEGINGQRFIMKMVK